MPKGIATANARKTYGVGGAGMLVG
jgi:hypothetical protein